MQRLNSGDPIIYFGSVDRARGSGVYRGLCDCEACVRLAAHGLRVARHRVETVAGPVVHVRSVSFIPAVV